MPLPHIKNISAGNSRWDPMLSAVFEVRFSLPEMVNDAIAMNLGLESPDYHNETLLLTEQVTNVSGLDALQKTVQAGSQKFLGVDVSFLNPALDNTYAEFTIDFNLNLRNVTDAYTLKLIKLWSKLGYDMITGTRTIKRDYVAPYVQVIEANRNGVIWRIATFKDVLLTNVTGLDTLDYTANEARKLQCTFRSDYWDEQLGTGIVLGTGPAEWNNEIGTINDETNGSEANYFGTNNNRPGFPTQP